MRAGCGPGGVPSHYQITLDTSAAHPSTVVVDEEVDEVDEEVEEEMDSLSDNTGHLASSPKQVTPYPWVAYLSFAASF